ncbi:MAG: YbaY family lipoprotein [Phycisphaerales bacterium]|nr:YbaY family lipoprotein [Phycisphaerales bacterium]
MRTLILLTALLTLTGCSMLKFDSGNNSGGGGNNAGGGGSGGGGGGGAGGGGGNTNTPPATFSGKVTGSALYRERIVLPQDAIVIVQVVDAANINTVLTQKQIPTGGKAPPYNFELTYDPKKVNAQTRYLLRAEILVRGTKRFTTDTNYPIITQGAPSHYELVLKAARQ